LSYQAFGGRMTNSWLQKISIGDLNTGDELAQYLAELTGFTQFTCISAGHKVELAGNSGPLCDLRIGLGLLIVKKVADTPERTAAGHRRASSPVDRKITDHFAELYDLLNLEERLAKEVFSFLDLFPAQERARDLIQGMDGSIDEVLPVDKPYKLLYCAKALRSCIEDESFSTVPNVDFLRYCVRIVIETFGRQTSMHNDDIIDLRIAHLLIECLVLALRVHVPAEISSVYITNPERYTEYLLGMLEKARGMPTAEGSIPEIHIFVRDFFTVLSEGTLHHPQIWEHLQKDDRFGRLLEQRLLEDTRLDVRKAVAGVIFGLTGSSGSKIFLKIQDPRSPRARFPSANVDDSLAKWWSYLVELVPKATSQPLRCQQLLEVSDAVVRCVGKSREPEELKSLFQTWSELLVGYNYVEVSYMVRLSTLR
jgi:ubiquitin carboxyl-terminal hydrolase 34